MFDVESLPGGLVKIREKALAQLKKMHEGLLGDGGVKVEVLVVIIDFKR